MNSILLESDKLNSAIGIGFVVSENLTTKKFNQTLENFLLKKEYMIRNETFKDKLISLNQRRRFILNKVKNLSSCTLENEDYISLLSVPTGFGKTYCGLYYGSKIITPRSNTEYSNFIQINPRIIYALPFLSIIEQVEETIKAFLKTIEKDEEKIKSSSFLVHHHLTEPVFNLENDQEYDESTADLFIKGWNSQYILSTFNQLLNALFKTDKYSSLKFSKILNTSWILDEVQSIPLKYWKIFEEFLLILNKIFSVNLLMMSATLPKIIDIKNINKNIVHQKNKIKVNEIIDNKEYTNLLDGINRIKLAYYGSITFSLFLENLKNEIQNIIKQKTNTLIVLNTRKSAQMTYKVIKDFKRVLEDANENNDVLFHIEFLA
ncbi:MAG: DEAD/DEAH box helicase, partial [Candidatus Lokiarchaeota archaeon]